MFGRLTASLVAICSTCVLIHIQGVCGLSNPIVPVHISIHELLSTCVDACFRGCAEIRAVQQKREASIDKSLQQVEFKNALDPKSALTEADKAAQAAIVSALRREWGGHQLRIVGEEDDEDVEMDEGGTLPWIAPSNSEAANRGLRRDLCTNLSNDDDMTVPVQDIIVFVDPLDGTREFVEGRLSNCQTLIGVAVNGQAVAGAIGIPFPDGTMTKDTTVVYGHAGAGHYGVVGSTTVILPSNPHNNDGSLRRPFIASGDSTAPVMVTARALALEQVGGTSVLYGGAGNKILATAVGHVDGTIQHCFGGPWDVCAPAAVLRSMGGRITNLLGEEIYITSSSGDRAPSLGFVATGAGSGVDHDELVRVLRASPVVRAYTAR